MARQRTRERLAKVVPRSQRAKRALGEGGQTRQLDLAKVREGGWPADCFSRIMSKRFVYVLKNTESPPRYYTGVSANVAARLLAHNAGESRHTAKYRPWSVDVVIQFTDEGRAYALERYLKSGSGIEFARRHLR